MIRKYPENPQPKLDLAATFLNLGNSYKDIHQDEKGLEYYRKSVKVYESLLNKDATNTEVINYLAKSLHNIAVWLADRNRPQEALNDYLKVLKFQESNVISHPSTVEYLKDYSGTNYNIGNLYLSLGRIDDAFSSFQKAIKIQQEIIQLNPTNIVYQIELASSYNAIALLYRKLDNRKDALSYHLRAIDIQRGFYLANKSTSQMMDSLADNLNDVAWWIALNPGQGLEIYQQAIHLSKESVSMKRKGPAYAYTLALAQYRAGFFNDALDTIDKLRRGLKPITDSDVTPSHLAVLSLCLYKTDHKMDAMKSYNQMVMIIQKDKYESDLDSQALFKECTVTIYPTDLPLDPFQK
jgi:tetratricopeptide (TPR) repeat protein